MTRLFSVFLIITLLCFSTFAQFDLAVTDAEEDLVYYSADIIKANLVDNMAELHGNVKILFETYELNANHAEIFKNTTTLRAWGDVRVKGQNSFIEAKEIQLNYKTQEGVITNVRLTSGQFLLEGKKIERLSENEYIAYDSKFTTCTSCPPGWSIKGKKIKTNIKEYVQIFGGRFQVLNQSILPLPNLKLPLNTRRKTGFIPPTIDNSSRNSGLGFAQPYFWAIDPHRDLTLTPIAYFDDEDFSLSGGKLLTEYNQWLSSKSRLNLKSAYMYDGLLEYPEGNLNPDTRWFLDYDNYFVLPRDFIQRTDFTLVKERTYLQDFIRDVDGFGQAALKNSFSISKSKGNRYFSGELVYYINLLVSDPQQNENFSIHKLPEINYSVINTPFLNNTFLFNTNVTYTNFTRNYRSFDEIALDPSNSNLPKTVSSSGDGKFDAQKDLLRTGHRLRIESQISAPFQIAKTFDVMPALNYRDSYYKFNLNKSNVVNESANAQYSPFAYSRYLEFSNSFKTEFSRVYGDRYKHKIIPEIIGKYGTSVDQSSQTFFNSQGSLPYHRQYQPITDQDFFDFRQGVQFDYWDRFYRAEVVELNLTNVIIRKNKEELVSYYTQPVFFNLSQSYDFENARLSDNPDPWSNLNATLKLKSRNFISHTQASYFYKAAQTNITTRNRFIYLPGRYVGIEYTDFITVDERGDLTTNQTQNIRLELGWEFPELKFTSYFDYSLIESKKNGWGADFIIIPRGNCWGFGAEIWNILNSEKVNFNLQFEFLFGTDPNNPKKSFRL